MSLFCYESDFTISPSDDKQADIIEAFKSTSRYLDDLLNIDNPYFEGMVNQIYPLKLQLNKANTSDTVVPFLDIHLSFSIYIYLFPPILHLFPLLVYTSIYYIYIYLFPTKFIINAITLIMIL